MSEWLRFDEETEVAFEGALDVQDVHLQELSFVLGFDNEEGHVDRCVVDLPALIKAMTLYTSMEQLRHGWRRRSSPPQSYRPDEPK